MNEIINRVAKSDLIQIDLERELKLLKKKSLRIDFGIFLHEGVVLREKPFREMLKKHNWGYYTHQIVEIYCSPEVIVPAWANLLLQVHLNNAKFCYLTEDSSRALLSFFTESLDLALYREKKVIIKGCSRDIIAPQVYLDLVRKLTGVANSIMYGEPCSSVPLYKKKKPL